MLYWLMVLAWAHTAAPPPGMAERYEWWANFVACPGAAVAMIGCVVFAVLLIRSHRRVRAWKDDPQRCAECSYDLRGNDSGVCPECGVER